MNYTKLTRNLSFFAASCFFIVLVISIYNNQSIWISILNGITFLIMLLNGFIAQNKLKKEKLNAKTGSKSDRR